MKKKYVYIVVDTDDNIISHNTAFLSEQSALDYAIKMNKIRLANGMYLMNYQIKRLCIESS